MLQGREIGGGVHFNLLGLKDLLVDSEFSDECYATPSGRGQSISRISANSFQLNQATPLVADYSRLRSSFVLRTKYLEPEIEKFN